MNTELFTPAPPTATAAKEPDKGLQARIELGRLQYRLRELVQPESLAEAVEDYRPRLKNKAERAAYTKELTDLLDTQTFWDVLRLDRLDPKQLEQVADVLHTLTQDITAFANEDSETI